jgi:hypothetical protein
LCDLESAEVVKKKQTDRVKPPSTASTRWRAPADEVIKVNVDAPVSNNLNKARNNNKNFMGASTVIFQGCSDPETLEALTCQEALSLAAVWAPRIQVASDCQVVVVKNYHEGNKGAYAHIIHAIKERRSEFQEFSLVFKGRSANKDAHNRARFAVFNDFGRLVWLLNPPDGVDIPVHFEV